MKKLLLPSVLCLGFVVQAFEIKDEETFNNFEKILKNIKPSEIKKEFEIIVDPATGEYKPYDDKAASNLKISWLGHGCQQILNSLATNENQWSFPVGKERISELVPLCYDFLLNFVEVVENSSLTNSEKLKLLDPLKLSSKK